MAGIKEAASQQRSLAATNHRCHAAMLRHWPNDTRQHWLAHHSTRSPPPPPSAKGWKKATQPCRQAQYRHQRPGAAIALDAAQHGIARQAACSRVINRPAQLPPAGGCSPWLPAGGCVSPTTVQQTAMLPAPLLAPGPLPPASPAGRDGQMLLEVCCDGSSECRRPGAAA